MSENKVKNKKFTAFTEDPQTGLRRFSYEAWRIYWTSLSENEKQSLRDKASWERMTLSAVAIEWGC